MENKISDRDLSFVVQGNVAIDKDSGENFTRKACESIRRYFPHAEIILSTWEGQDIQDIPHDLACFSSPIETHSIIRPDGKSYFHTVNHEIITSRKGLALCKRKYAVKLRSDMVFYGEDILKYLHLYENHATENYCFFQERVLVLPCYNYRRTKLAYPYNICDWIYAGLQTDLLDLFSIPLEDYSSLRIRDGEKIPRVEDNMGAEQYIWVAYLRKKGHLQHFYNRESFSSEEWLDFEKTIAENFVFLSADTMQVNILKSPFASYASRPILSQGLYTNMEWKRLYNSYGGGRIKIVYNPLEDILYWVFYHLRHSLASRCPKIHRLCTSAFRKLRKRR